MFNLDGGAGYIISAIVGSFAMWLLTRFDRHSDNVGGAHEKVDDLEKKFLEYKAHVAEHYQMKIEHRDFEKAVFKKLDDIVALINTKADK